MSAVDPIAGLLEMVRREATAAAVEAVRAEMRATAAEAKPSCVVLSLADATNRYGVGRIYLKQMIATGKLPTIERRCRGGRLGQFVHLSDCERVLAGRKA